MFIDSKNFSVSKIVKMAAAKRHREKTAGSFLRMLPWVGLLGGAAYGAGSLAGGVGGAFKGMFSNLGFNSNFGKAPTAPAQPVANKK